MAETPSSIKTIGGTASTNPRPVGLQPTLANKHQQTAKKPEENQRNTATDTNQPRNAANSNSTTPLQKKAAARRANRTTKHTAPKETSKKQASVSAPVPTPPEPSSKDKTTENDSSLATTHDTAEGPNTSSLANATKTTSKWIKTMAEYNGYKPKTPPASDYIPNMDSDDSEDEIVAFSLADASSYQQSTRQNSMPPSEDQKFFFSIPGILTVKQTD